MVNVICPYVSTLPKAQDIGGLGGSDIIIKSNIKRHLLELFCTDLPQATNTSIEFLQKITISSIYCSPRHIMHKNQFELFNIFKAVVTNSKQTHWGSRLINT